MALNILMKYSTKNNMEKINKLNYLEEINLRTSLKLTINFSLLL